jgi:hypothetical protein
LLGGLAGDAEVAGDPRPGASHHARECAVVVAAVLDPASGGRRISVSTSLVSSQKAAEVVAEGAPLRWRIPTVRWLRMLLRVPSEAEGQLIECDANPIMHRQVGGEFVVPATKVLHKGVPCCDHACRVDPLQPAHRM